TKEAEKIKKQIEQNIQDGVEIEVGDKVSTITKEELYRWLTFSAKKTSLATALDDKKAASYLDKELAPAVAKPSGTTIVTTHDFAVISEKKGKKGQTLDREKTLASILTVVQGKVTTASVA